MVCRADRHATSAPSPRVTRGRVLCARRHEPAPRRLPDPHAGSARFEKPWVVLGDACSELGLAIGWVG